jgi:hypothetical protein
MTKQSAQDGLCGRCKARMGVDVEHDCPLYTPEPVGDSTNYMRSGYEAGVFASVRERRVGR